MKVCSLRASARAAARLRRGVRRGVARRLDARLRRPSRPALSPLARDELRPGAVGVGPRLVGGLSGAAVLSARFRVPRRAPRVGDHGRSRRRDGLPGAALARLSPARSHDVRRARAADRPALARAGRGLRRAHAVGGAGPRRGWRRARGALGALVLAAALTAFWALPLLLRLAETRALAWGTLSLGEVARPLPIVLAALAVAGLLDRTPAGAGERLALWWLPAMVVATALDRLAAEPLGIRWLPADRIVDGAWIALVVAGGVGAARLAWRLDAMPIMQRLGVSPRSPAFGLGAAALFALLSLGSDTLMLRPGAGGWPSLSSIERGLRLPDFWSLLGRLPEGRLLFVRSGVPLVYGGNWWRPHTHVTALTPVGGGRDIVHRTLTHPSPIAAPVYPGHARPGALPPLAEQLDGRTLFGEKLEALDPARFSTQADRLGVVAVVALEDDETQLGWLAESTAFRRRLSLAPFVVFARGGAGALPTARDGVWRTTLAGEAGGWACARPAYYPLRRPGWDGAPLPTRRGADGLLEVRLTRALQTVTLRYDPGLPELAGGLLSAVALAAWAVSAWRSG